MEQKEFVCPKCFQKQQFKNVGYLCENTNPYVNCENAKMRKVITFSKPVKKLVCDKCNMVLRTMLCPQCGYVIPPALKECENHSIAILGAKNVGKSNYIAVLIQELYNSCSGSLIETLKAEDQNTLERFKTEFRDPLYKNKTALQGTDMGEVAPLIYSLKEKKKKTLFSGSSKNIIMTFFDTAGENLDNEEIMKSYNGYLSQASYLLLLLDPLQIPKVREQLLGRIVRLPDMQSDPNDILNRVINLIKRDRSVLKDGKLNMELAVVFTKIDAVDSLLEPSSCLKNNSRHAEKGGFDKVDFEDENEEMRSMVSYWLGGEGFCNLAETNFKSVAYFGVSALGSSPDLNNQIPKFRPFRVTDPFLWVLYKLGMIKAV